MDNIVIYSKDNCPYCDMAINLAKSKGMDMSVLKLETDYTVEEFSAKFIYARSVPQIILNGEHIGGYQDLVKLVQVKQARRGVAYTGAIALSSNGERK